MKAPMLIILEEIYGIELHSYVGLVDVDEE
jgi:hypothetical protein